MTTRSERTHDFREHVKLEYSFNSLNRFIEDAIKYRDIQTYTFWYLLVLEQEFRIEWIGKVNPKKWGQQWRFKDISDLYKFDISWVNLYPNEEWDWDNISANFKLDIEWVRKYPDKKWNFKYISSAFDFNINWIKEYPNKPWDWEHIILSKHFTVEWLVYFPEEWTVEIVLEMINKKNKQKTPELSPHRLRLRSHPDDKTVFNNSKFREYMAAYKIQQWWHFITLSPTYKIGRKFINQKYDDLF